MFIGHWVGVTETIYYSNSGSYDITIKKVSDNSTILSYSNANIDMWQDGASIARPKWGIYRSLINIDDLQDEEVLFNNFSIEEIDALSVSDLETKTDATILVPNPSKDSVTIKNAKANDYDSVILYNTLGETIPAKNRLSNNTLDISDLSSGMYYIVLTKNNRPVEVLKCLVE